MQSLVSVVAKVPTRKPATIVVIGDFMLDHFIWGISERISPEGPVPVIHVQSEIDCLGGAGNVVANLRGLDVNVLPIGVVGQDAAGRRIIDLLVEIGCVTDGLVEVTDRPTVQKTRVIAQTQHVVRLDREVILPLGTDVIATLWERAVRAIELADVCVVSDYAKGVCDPDLIKRVIEWARAKKVAVLVDPKRKDFTVYKNATCITPNLLETRQAMLLEETDSTTIANAAQTIHERYQIDNVLITRGADGVTLFSQGIITHIPTKAKEVYDVSGAGDTMIATLAAALTWGENYEVAAHLANVAAGIVVGKLGTAPITFIQLFQALQTNGIRRPHTKVYQIRDLLNQLAVWRSSSKKIIFTNGCFDILHIGHVTLLEMAKELGDILIVGLNTDACISRLKGSGRPINREQYRAMTLAGLAAVDAVILFEDDTPLDLIRQIKPDILVKGADYRKEEVVGGAFVESEGGEVILIPLIDGYSTTSMIGRINHCGSRHTT